jgi:hypothetical protein
MIRNALRLAPLALLVFFAAPAQAQTPTQTTEVLVLTTATALPNLSGRMGIEILNLGPNDIWCALGSSTLAVVNKSRKVAASGGSWSLSAGDKIKIWCIASTANQVTGAATIVTELRR